MWATLWDIRQQMPLCEEDTRHKYIYHLIGVYGTGQNRQFVSVHLPARRPGKATDNDVHTHVTFIVDNL